MKSPKGETRATKLDALHLKKYYVYFMKENRTKPLEWLVENAMASLNHLFDAHSFCSESWCLKKRISTKSTDDTVTPPTSQRLEEGYNRSMVENQQLYEAIKAHYQKYILKEFLSQSHLKFDTNLNERMNQSLASYALK